jgi:Polyketide cyclase / dehydrase and lipid transport
MATVEHQVRIARPADEVWEVLCDFWGLAEWFPGIENCEKTSDDIRTIRMGNIAIDEQLLERDDDARSFAYTIAKSPMPLEFHRAEWSVAEDGDGSLLTVRAEVSPDDAMGLMGPVYEQAADGLRKHLEG